MAATRSASNDAAAVERYEPDLPARLHFLASPAAHEPGSGPVVLHETHMSWLVLDDRQVLKLKKPVCYPPYLDCRTVAQRERDARAEVHLNRRLAPDVYRGLLALRWDGQAFALVPDGVAAPAGRTLDWLVQMRRLPHDRMLDCLIRTGRLQPAQIEALALVLSRFYQHALPARATPALHLARFRSEQSRNRAVLSDPRFDLPDAGRALDRLDDLLVQQTDALAQRVRQWHVVDGHGDLRPEHVCLVDPPVVIDGLTFAESLRQVDPFEELSSLALDCEHLGAAWVGDLLIRRCVQRLDDDPPPALLQLYRTSRALLRARLAVAHLLDPAPREPARWLALGRAHLALALQAGSAAAPA